MRVGKYKRRPVTIEAVKVPVPSKFTNHEAWANALMEVAAWCGGTIYRVENTKSHTSIIVPGPKGEMWAGLGDYIVKSDEGGFYTIRENTFHQTYEPDNVGTVNINLKGAWPTPVWGEGDGRE